MPRLLRIFSPGRLILALTVIIAGYFLVSAADSLVASHRLAQEEQQLEQRIEALRSQERRLEQIRDYLRTDQYVEYIARRVFGLVRPGETLVIVEAQAPESTEEPAGLLWWEQIFGP